jgi:hypothetical protein
VNPLPAQPKGFKWSQASEKLNRQPFHFHDVKEGHKLRLGRYDPIGYCLPVSNESISRRYAPSQQALNEADRLLNQIYQELRKSLMPEDFKLLKLQERECIKEHEKVQE